MAKGCGEQGSVSSPERLWCHTGFFPARRWQAVLGADAAACHGACTPSPASRAFSGRLLGVSDPSFCLPSCLETPMLWPPPPLETTAPSPRNQRPCDISAVAKGTAGNASPAGSLSAAALVVTSPRFWQLAHATGSDEFAPAPHPAGPVLACARRLGQLWVSG